MSGKRDKLNRQAQEALPPEFQITISAWKRGKGFKVTVGGFPNSLNTTLQLLSEAVRIVVAFFIDKAKRGKLDNNNVLEQSGIILPDKDILTPMGHG